MVAPLTPGSPHVRACCDGAHGRRKQHGTGSCGCACGCKAIVEQHEICFILRSCQTTGSWPDRRAYQCWVALQHFRGCHPENIPAYSELFYVIGPEDPTLVHTTSACVAPASMCGECHLISAATSGLYHPAPSGLHMHVLRRAHTYVSHRGLSQIRGHLRRVVGDISQCLTRQYSPCNRQLRAVVPCPGCDRRPCCRPWLNSTSGAGWRTRCRWQRARSHRGQRAPRRARRSGWWNTCAPPSHHNLPSELQGVCFRPLALSLHEVQAWKACIRATATPDRRSPSPLRAIQHDIPSEYTAKCTRMNLTVLDNDTGHYMVQHLSQLPGIASTRSDPETSTVPLIQLPTNTDWRQSAPKRKAECPKTTTLGRFFWSALLPSHELEPYLRWPTHGPSPEVSEPGK